MTPPPLRRPSRVEAALLGLAVLAGASQAAPTLVLINETPSLPRGLYLRLPGQAPRRGAVVVAAPPPPARAYLRALGAPEAMRLLKRVAATGGDRVCATAGAVETPLRRAAVRTRDRRGAALPAWRGCGPLPADQVFLLGDSPDSFDSRYFGPVTRGEIDGVFREVLTW